MASGESHSGLDLAPIAAQDCEAKYAATLAISWAPSWIISVWLVAPECLRVPSLNACSCASMRGEIARLDIRGLCNLRNGQENGQPKHFFHGSSLGEISRRSPSPRTIEAEGNPKFRTYAALIPRTFSRMTLRTVLASDQESAEAIQYH